MKPFIITALLLFSATAMYAQQPPSVSRDVEKLFQLRDKKYNLSPTPSDGRVYRIQPMDTSKPEPYKRLLEGIRVTKEGLVLSTYSHQTSRGKVYILSPDNMPCLVPNTKAVAVMPNGFKGVIPDEKMNAMPKQKIIPEGKP